VRIRGSKGKTGAAAPDGGHGELRGTGAVGERVHLAGLGHVPVLAIRYRHERREVRVVGIVDLEIVDRPIVQSFLHTPYVYEQRRARVQGSRRVDSNAVARLLLRNEQVVIGRELRRRNGPDVLEVRAQGGEYLVVRREEDRRATGRLQRKQLAGIMMREHFGHSRLLASTRPGVQGAREPDPATVLRSLLPAALEQLRNPPHPVRRRNQRVRVETELAGEIASGRAEGEHTRPRQEMIERLLLDGIDAKAAGPAVAEELDAAGFRPAHEAQPPLPIVQLAGPGADVALHASV